MNDVVVATPVASRGGVPRLRGAIAKNMAAGAVLLGGWLALSTGYLSPDRPTRDQWQRLESARKGGSAQVVYQSDFAVETPGVPRNPMGHWGFYNGATVSTVQYDPAGVTITYGGTPWIGAVLHFKGFEAQRIYRLTIERVVEGEPGAVIVRNRQMDLTRVQVPVGSGPHAVYFIAPKGGLDRVDIAFIPDNRGKPAGKMRIAAARIELMNQQGGK